MELGAEPIDPGYNHQTWMPLIRSILSSPSSENSECHSWKHLLILTKRWTTKHATERSIEPLGNQLNCARGNIQVLNPSKAQFSANFIIRIIAKENASKRVALCNIIKFWYKWDTCPGPFYTHSSTTIQYRDQMLANLSFHSNWVEFPLSNKASVPQQKKMNT